MELHKIIDGISSKHDLAKFINHLRQDLRMNKNDWENPNLEDFLEGMEAWILDEGDLPQQPNWKTFADILYASKMYE